jgi:hypothetical protein
MKHNFLSILYFSFASGCDKKLEEINIDPTKLTPHNIQFNYLFTAAELFTAGNADGFSGGIFQSSLSYSSTMMQQLSSTDMFSWLGDKYIYNGIENGAFWGSQYSSSIKSIVDVIENIKPDERKASIIFPHSKGFLISAYDGYDDIPYFEGGLGSFMRPLVPIQLTKDIYADLLAELEDRRRSDRKQYSGYR